MSTAIWIQTSYHQAFKCGGWAYVRSHDKAASGQAGGDRFELRLEVVGRLRDIGHCQHLTQLDSSAAGRELGQPDSQRRTVGLWPTPDCGTDVG